MELSQYPIPSPPLLSYLIPSYPIPSPPILSCPILSYPIPSHPLPSPPLLSSPTPSHPILSHPLLSCPLLPYPILSHCVALHTHHRLYLSFIILLVQYRSYSFSMLTTRGSAEDFFTIIWNALTRRYNSGNSSDQRLTHRWV